MLGKKSDSAQMGQDCGPSRLSFPTDLVIYRVYIKTDLAIYDDHEGSPTTPQSQIG